jgi:hypothetical protein
VGQTVVISPNRTDFLWITLFILICPVWDFPSNYFLKAETRPLVMREPGFGSRSLKDRGYEGLLLSCELHYQLG